MNANQGISIIIPTYNSRDILKKTLDSLVDQYLSKDKYEVLIIDDGSSDDTRSMVEPYKSIINVSYFYQQDSGFRVAKARNIGIDSAIFNRILFFDAGMLASPMLLQKHYVSSLSNSSGVTIGMSYGINEFTTENSEDLVGILEKNSVADAFSVMKQNTQLFDCRYEYLKSINFEINTVTVPWILCWTSHLSCSTEIIRELGGFDEYFSSWGGEDVELGIRLFQFGCKFQLMDSFESIHYPHYKDGEKRKETAKQNIDYIDKKHNLHATKLMKNHGWQEVIRLA
ncbi:hypothetical protein BGP78_19090 [Pseudoalteromonas sp. MSK9-3]|uniref:glycosyltransferase n=1 Tax=Pseudoalteromonas sp. MSK9-3 TaxID=1897633 RepID=UPI000E6C4659|nr:glycosyltransferase [Pseudoalteromonas sp. MSK9-3]RJE73421.1 hypothetical protein BGP78_19090 [Pseudoalteromonas sp. MSK9-3]